MRRLSPRQRFHSSFPQVPLNVAPFASNSRQVELLGARSSDDHEIHSGRKQVRPKPKALAAHTLDAIALHGVADLPADDQSETGGASVVLPFGSLPYALLQPFGWLRSGLLERGRPCRRLRRDEQREVRSHHAPAELLGSDELGVTAEPSIRPERKRHPPRRELLLVDGRNEMHPTLAATVREDFPAAARGHAGAKAVRARTPDVVGLICALHDVVLVGRLLGPRNQASIARPVKRRFSLARPSPPEVEASAWRLGWLSVPWRRWRRAPPSGTVGHRELTKLQEESSPTAPDNGLLAMRVRTGTARGGRTRCYVLARWRVVRL